MSDAPSKSYNPRDVEPRIYRRWLDLGAFHPTPDDRPPEKRFVMVIPPPNVTGALHLGHALNNTLQDILIRKHRMAGFNTLWLPGTDHAGIATQATVEKDILKTEKKNRYDLGRKELVRRIWQWKERFGNRIVEQLQLMGCSCDWERLRFTLDEQCARAVRETFFKLFRDGLIYRGKRLVNWDTQLQTAVADDEVYHETVRGHLWHIRYPLTEPARGRAGSPDITHLVVATTRPETMLGDTAVAVHPDDPRFSHLIGRKVKLPLTDREIPIIGDGILVKREFGTGCVKVTPGHDPNDYQCALRNNLSMLNMMTPDGRVETAGPYKGLKLEDARKKVVADLEAAGLIEKIEEYETDVGHSDRSQVPIQPYLSDQWFVKMGDLEPKHAARIPELRGAPGLAQLAIDAVQRGEVRIHPERYAKTYLDWLGEKRDWCISRQLWWGHQIPVWTAHISHGAGPNVPEALWQKLAEGASSRAIDEITGYLDAAGVLNDEYSAFVNPPLLCVCARTERAEHALSTLDVLRRPDATAMPGDSRRGVVFAPEFQHAAKKAKQISAFGDMSREPDVLDTWFSSALWPHSTLGWPGEMVGTAHPTDAHPSENKGLTSGQQGASAGDAGASLPHGRGSDDTREGRPHHPASDLDYYYPTTVLSTAREIITLWVARMVMTGLYNIGKVPFRDVVIHAVIQDGQGRKMSKSLGNGVDPVDIIDAYGADALRYTLAELATETQDIRMPVKPTKLPDGRTVNTSDRFEKGRNFCNKLWQVSTGFVMRGLENFAPRPRRAEELQLEDRWILSRLAACQTDVDAALTNYHYSDYVQAIYSFMWNDFCDWYVEMVKPRLREGGDSAAPARQVLIACLDRLLRLLHPVTPFITEAIWEQLNAAAPRRGVAELLVAEPALVTAAWPAPRAADRNTDVEADMDILKAVIRAIRDIRARVNAMRAAGSTLRTLPLAVVRGGTRCCQLLAAHDAFVRTLAGCDRLEFGPEASKPPGSMTHVHESAQIFAPVGDLVDLAAEAKRLRAELEEKSAAHQREAERLSNEAFVSRAAPDIVERSRARVAELERQILMLRQHLADLG